MWSINYTCSIGVDYLIDFCIVLVEKTKKFLIKLFKDIYSNLLFLLKTSIRKGGQIIIKSYYLKVYPRLVVSKRKRILTKVSGKQTIRVVFLAIHKSVWKVDPVFKKMLKDPCFDPVILVCPYVQYGHQRMVEDLESAYEYFVSKGYPVHCSYNKEANTWVRLEELKPDLLFFTNPHNLTRKEYYSEAFRRYLSVYVPYYFMATDHAGDPYQLYATPFLSSMFKIYWPSDYHLTQQNKMIQNLVNNGIVCGYPAMEPVIDSTLHNSAWKPQTKEKKKIIFAPHHSIDLGDKSLSSFLAIASFMQALARKYSDKVQWSFKPHPILKAKLFKHSEWGVKKTEAYYKFWSDNSYTQLDEGEYVDLFKQSDAIIHDSSSFIAEYTFLRKPALYLMARDKADSIVNSFGQMFLKQYLITDNKEQIDEFVCGVIEDKLYVEPDLVLDAYISKFYLENTPSSFIINNLKQTLVV